MLLCKNQKGVFMAKTRLETFIGGLANGAIIGAIACGVVDGADGAIKGAVVGAGVSGPLNALVHDLNKKIKLRESIKKLYEFKGMDEVRAECQAEVAMDSYSKHLKSDSKRETEYADTITLLEQVKAADEHQARYARIKPLLEQVGNKLRDKYYFSHSGFVGGAKHVQAKEMMEKNSDKAVERAVKGMLPKNALGRQMFRKLKVYKGDTHPHAAQAPRVYSLVGGGTGNITINGQPLDTYFVNGFLKLIVNQPFKTANISNFDAVVSVQGGGLTGQAGAIRHGIARGLVKENEQVKSELKKAGYLKRDPRMKERKKYGLKKARRAPQFSKR
ncbi:ribosomal protein s9 [Holotrichia oblita]|nr:ribosomal protein s9 [Holotrichia oblita]